MASSLRDETGAELLPAVPIAWGRLIHELLQRQASYTDLNENNITWGTQAIVKILPTLSAEVLYKDLVYLNTGSKIGKFALVFGDRIATAIKKQDIATLEAILQAATTPEFDDNKYLPNDEYLRWSKQLGQEMVAFNALMDRVVRLTIIPTTLLTSEEYAKCQQDVCVWTLAPDGVASGTARDRVLLLDRQADPMVWVADESGSQQVYEAWCFKLPDLIKIIMQDLNNPYTGVPFLPRVVLSLRQRYHVECLLVKRYLEVMGATMPLVAVPASPIKGNPLPLP